MADRKTFRLDKLSPDARKMVEEEIEQHVAEDRLRQLVLGNKRLLDAAEAVDGTTTGNGDAMQVISDAIQSTRTANLGERPAS